MKKINKKILISIFVFFIVLLLSISIIIANITNNEVSSENKEKLYYEIKYLDNEIIIMSNLINNNGAYIDWQELQINTEKLYNYWNNIFLFLSSYHSRYFQKEVCMPDMSGLPGSGKQQHLLYYRQYSCESPEKGQFRPVSDLHDVWREEPEIPVPVDMSDQICPTDRVSPISSEVFPESLSGVSGHQNQTCGTGNKCRRSPSCGRSTRSAVE